MIGFGCVIGVAWVFMPGIWIADLTVVGAIIAFVIGGTLTAYLTLIYKQLLANYSPLTGEIALAKAVQGNHAGFLVGWGLYLFFFSGVVFECFAMVWLIESFYPSIMMDINLWLSGVDAGKAGYFFVSILLLGSIAFFNIFGVGLSSNIQTVLVFLLAIGILLAAVLAFSYGTFENLATGTEYFGTSGWWEAFGLTMITIPLWFVGFNALLEAGQGSQKTFGELGRLTLLVVALGALVHVASILIAGSLAPRTAYLEAGAAPGLRMVLDVMPYGDVFSLAIFVAALCGLFSTANAMFIASYMTLTGMARNNYVHAWFGRSYGKHGTSYHSIATTICLALSVVATMLSIEISTKEVVSRFVSTGGMCIVVVYLTMIYVSHKSRFKSQNTIDLTPPLYSFGSPFLFVFLFSILAMSIYFALNVENRAPIDLVVFVSWFFIGLVYSILYVKH
jgi:amino acid transporter